MRLRRLDILRGVAVLLVLFRHVPSPAPEIAAPMRTVLQTLIDVGWIGVDLFFVLSGFLVAGLLFREYQRYGVPSWNRFWIRRGFKIYPAFYALMLTTWWVWSRSEDPMSSEARARLVYEVVYLQNYFGGLWNHTWSLAIEEHAYFVIPLLLALMARGTPDPFRRSWVVIPLLCGAVLMGRIASVRVPAPYEPYLFATHFRIDSLLWGVLLSYAFHFRDRAWLGQLRAWWPLAVATIAALLAPAYFQHIGASIFLATWGLTTIALAFTLLLALTLAEPGSTATDRGPLAGAATVMAAIGVDSYSIYLWHMPVHQWLMPWWKGTLAPSGIDPTAAFALDIAVYLLGSILAGMLLARVIERPMLALRDRLVPSRVRAL